MDKRRFLKRLGLLPLAMLPSVEAEAQPTVINNITVNQVPYVPTRALRDDLIKELTNLQRTGRLSLK